MPTNQENVRHRQPEVRQTDEEEEQGLLPETKIEEQQQRMEEDQQQQKPHDDRVPVKQPDDEPNSDGDESLAERDDLDVIFREVDVRLNDPAAPK